MFDQETLKRVKSAERLAVLTGAGISAESGISTFRGEDGIWTSMKPEELASFDAFMKNPDLVWEWYQMRRSIVEEREPNPGHFALADMEKVFKYFTLITQNVDGLHQRAGSTGVLELHGNIMRSKCLKCVSITNTHPVFDKELPKCECGGLLRPDVVWFGEMLPEDVLRTAFYESSNCDVFLCVGTSAVVHPAASLPVAAKQSGAYVIEINTEKTVLTDFADKSILAPSGRALPELLKSLQGLI